jgi:hypothetical protein
MKLNAHFFLLNIDFSQEHADANHNGEESENNLKYEWEDHLSLSNEIKTVKTHEGSFPLQGELPDGTSFKEEVDKMVLFECEGDDNSKTYFACSKQLIESYEIKEQEDTITLNVYFKDYEPLSNPTPGVYIAAQDFPKKLIF